MPSVKKAKIIGVDWNFSSVWNECFRTYPEKPLEKRDRIYASELDGSFRDRYLKMYAHPYSNPINFRSRSKMMVGDFFEDIVGLVLTATGLLKQRQMRGVIELPGMLPVSGKCDFVVGGVTDWDKAKEDAERIRNLFLSSNMGISKFTDYMIEKILPRFMKLFSYNPAAEYVFECKSVSGFVFSLIERTNKPRRGHDLQCLHYLLSNKDISAGLLQYISREDAMLHDFKIERSTSLLKLYKKDVATMTEYYNAGKKNYLKNMPPPDEELIFEEAAWKIAKNNKVEYSPYLTYTYGYKSIDDYNGRWKSSISRWNRVFRKCVLGEKITADNMLAMREAKVYFPGWDKLVSKAKAAGAFEKPEEVEDEP